jgi:SAM-dependent methyltransferase
MQNALMNMEDNNRIRLENMQNALNERENSNQMQFENMKKMLSQIDQNNRMNDESYLHPDVPKLDKLSNWLGYLVEIGNKRGMKILEVGSRVVTGQNFRGHFAEAKYVGFDFYAGDNVDVVGDAHKLSSYFEKDEKFDIIFSAAVFEHFAMPWIVAKEMAKLLKVGGHVFVATHFSYSSHERPWHFFQFSDMALKVLFPSAMGFECIEVGMALPIVGRFSSLIEGELKNKPITGLYASVHFLGKKIKEVENFEYEKIDLADVVGETKYPEPNLLHGFQ